MLRAEIIRACTRSYGRSEFQIHFARSVNYSPVIPANHISTVILITSDRSLCHFPTPSLLPPPSSRPTVLPRTRARAHTCSSKLIYSQRAGIPTSSEAPPPPPTGEYEGCREEVGGGGRREEGRGRYTMYARILQRPRSLRGDLSEQFTISPHPLRQFFLFFFFYLFIILLDRLIFIFLRHYMRVNPL